MADDPSLSFDTVGSNTARPFGMLAFHRAKQVAANAGLDAWNDAPSTPVLLASLAYAWDPAWLKVMRGRPRAVLTLGGKPVMAHVPAGEDLTPVVAALESGTVVQGFEMLASET